MLEEFPGIAGQFLAGSIAHDQPTRTVLAMDPYTTMAPDLYSAPAGTDQKSAPAGNLAGPLGAFLQSFGVRPSRTQDGVSDRVAAELASRSLEAEIVSLRYGDLVLAATPQHAALLRWETARLLEVLGQSHPGEVAHIYIRTRRH